MNIPSPYLTVSEAAKYLRVTPLTIRRWTLKKEIAFCRAGKKLLFTQENLDNKAGRS